MKERLVGAAVLVALGVWLIPWILDGHEPPTQAAVDGEDAFALPAVDEPNRTQTRTIALTDAERNAGSVGEDVADASVGARAAADADDAETTSAASARADVHADEPAAQTPVADEPAAVAATAARPPEPAASRASPVPAAIEDGWFVQLGSFSDEENARRLAGRVATFGYKADVSAYRSGGRTLNRVRVGPSATRDEASMVASSLAAHGFVAQVVPAD